MNFPQIRITVTKKLSTKEVYGHPLPEVSDDLPAYCDQLEEGQVFTVEDLAAMPEGFCPWAWNDLYAVVVGLQSGGDFPWIKKKGLIYACCTDGARPVFFRIERV